MEFNISSQRTIRSFGSAFEGEDVERWEGVDTDLYQDWYENVDIFVNIYLYLYILIHILSKCRCLPADVKRCENDLVQTIFIGDGLSKFKIPSGYAGMPKRKTIIQVQGPVHACLWFIGCKN